MADFNLIAADGSVQVRDFANKGLATRYANKHGLTLSASVGALVLVEPRTVATITAEINAARDAQDWDLAERLSDERRAAEVDADEAELTADLDTADVDAVLADLATETPTAEETVSIRDRALSFDVGTVGAMIVELRASFDRRDTFEASNGLSLTADSSYTRERDRMVKASVAVARFFLALGIEPMDVVERKVSSNAMFNAKALKKVTEIALYVVGVGQRMERVTRAFIACALIATDRGIETITNDTNRKFLCSAGFSGQITDQDLIDHLDDLRHRAMTSGAETQSSQARNVLDVLGLGAITSVNKSRDAIKLDASHPFFAKFREDFMVAA